MFLKYLVAGGRLNYRDKYKIFPGAALVSGAALFGYIRLHGYTRYVTTTPDLTWSIPASGG